VPEGNLAEMILDFRGAAPILGGSIAMAAVALSVYRLMNKSIAAGTGH
jgi:hypothetical protein